MTPPDARQVAEQILKLLPVAGWDIYNTNVMVIEAFVQHALTEARRQVWEEAAKEAERRAIPIIDKHYVNSLTVFAAWLRQRALPSEQTETPR